jgi:flagellar biosynthesis/type III secretory pathway protein FliH
MENNTIYAKACSVSDTSAELILKTRNYYIQVEKDTQELIKSKRKAHAQKIRRIKNQAMTSGYKKGIQQGLHDTLATLKSAENLLIQQTQNSKLLCLELINAICHEVLKSEIQNNKLALLEKIESEISEIIDNQPIKIYLNPKNFAEISDLILEQYQSKGIYCISDTKISIGNAEIKTLAGKIMLDWQDHFENLIKKTAEILLENE